jgi:hypothetical protein
VSRLTLAATETCKVDAAQFTVGSRSEESRQGAHAVGQNLHAWVLDKFLQSKLTLRRRHVSPLDDRNVSCDVATLTRAFDLFPNTPHVETLAIFVRT